MAAQINDPMAKSREILANLAVRKAGESPSAGTTLDVLVESPERSIVSGGPGSPSSIDAGAFSAEAETVEGSPEVVRRIEADEETQKNYISSLSAYVEKTLSSLTARLDAVESRFTDGGILGISTQSSAALVQELVAERCLIVRQELETKYASMSADTKLIQRKLDSTAARLNHELEANKKAWKEEAVRIWEAVDTHTHEVNMAGSESMGTSIQNLHELHSDEGTEGVELLNDSTLDLTRVTFGSADCVPGRGDCPEDSRQYPPGPVALDEIGASLASLARQFPPGPPVPRESAGAHSLTATTVTLAQQPNHGEPPPLMGSSRRSPAQGFRAITTQQRGDSPPRQQSPQTQLRVTQQQGSVAVSLGGSQATPGQQFRWTQPQHGAANVVRARSLSPGHAPVSILKVADGAGSPQRPSYLPPGVATVPLGGSSISSVPGVGSPIAPVLRGSPDVTLGPPVDDSGMTIFSRRLTGPPMKGPQSPINPARKTHGGTMGPSVGNVGAWEPGSKYAHVRVRKPEA
mmetsp:Transcript_86471/g.149616  ORF Transcript_86471/g.149616 Transcript_86471/m.149616 type:complete len:520 (+) Transcript_86471:134-1693(+)